MNCARCHRPLKHAAQLAGMNLGPTCRKAIVDAVLQRDAVEITAGADPGQFDFFQHADLFRASAVVEAERGQE